MQKLEEPSIVESINVKIPLELYQKIKETPELNNYPIEELIFNSKLIDEACRKTQRLMNEAEALNDFWLNIIEEKP